MSVFSTPPSQKAPFGNKPVRVNWKRSRTGKFFRLIHLLPNLDSLREQGGVYLIWHMGLAPAWVYAGAATDLSQAVEAAQNDKDLMHYERFGGMAITWAPFRERYYSGVVRYLREAIQPRVKTCTLDDLVEYDPEAPKIPVSLPVKLPPGGTV